MKIGKSMTSTTKKLNTITTNNINKLIFNVAIIAILIWAWIGAEMNPSLLVEDAGNMWVLLNDFFPPDFTEWELYAEEMLITLQIAIWGTILSVIAAVPLGILSLTEYFRTYSAGKNIWILAPKETLCRKIPLECWAA